MLVSQEPPINGDFMEWLHVTRLQLQFIVNLVFFWDDNHLMALEHELNAPNTLNGDAFLYIKFNKKAWIEKISTTLKFHQEKKTIISPITF